MLRAQEHAGAQPSLLAQHAGHLTLLFLWIAIFALVVGRSKLKALNLTARRFRPSPNTLSVAACLVLAAGADWKVIGEHASSGGLRSALVALTVLQLAIAALVGTRPTDLLIRAVSSAGLVIAMWWVLSRGLAPAGAELTLADVLAFSAQLATAGFGWLVLSRTSVLSN